MGLSLYPGHNLPNRYILFLGVMLIGVISTDRVFPAELIVQFLVFTIFYNLCLPDILLIAA
jgi:hypothetical protein